MTIDYLKTARKNGLSVDSEVSEVELITTNPDFATNWKVMIDVKKRIADEKLAALSAIDEKFKDELVEAESQYAFILSISR